MRGYYGNKSIGYFDLRYKLYAPIDLKRYGIPVSYKGQKLPYHDNRLINHILETIYRRNTPKNPLGEIDENFGYTYPISFSCSLRLGNVSPFPQCGGNPLTKSG